MSAPSTTAELGRQVVGPVVAELCLRLWSLGALLDRPEDTAFLFCARGGLRMQLAYERFLAATGLPSTVRTAPLMVSRLVAMRPALQSAVAHGADDLGPATARTLFYEFERASVADVAQALTGVRPEGDRWQATMRSAEVTALLHHPDGAAAAAALAEQSALFERHFAEASGGAPHVVLVDTGLHGTTARLLAEALPQVRFSSALMASYFPPTRNDAPPRTFGLTLEADGYSPLRPRSVMLRYWHFVEWLFEPALPSVRTFTEVDGRPRSNLEVPGWADRVEPDPGTVFAEVLAYLDALPAGSAEQVTLEAERAWDRLHRAVVFPRAADATLLAVSDRTHDFGRDETFGARPWRGPLAALRGSAMWREGEIARARTPWRVPLLAALQAGYGARTLRRALRG